MTTELTIPHKPALNPLFRMQYETAQKSHVLLYPEGMVKLNDSASQILLLCDGSRTVDEIVNELERKFGLSNLGPDITHMLAESTRRNWLIDA